MAGDGVIPDYLDALRHRMRGRADLDELIDEIADHLHSAAEKLEIAGVSPIEAAHRALARLGEPRIVAALLTSTPSKGTIMSLFVSRHLGGFAAVAAVAWAAAAGASFFGFTSLSGSWDQRAYLLSAVLVGVACLATAAVLLGVNIRAKGQTDAASTAITVLALFAAVAATLLAWVVALWLPLLAAAVTWTCIRARRAHAGHPGFAVAMAIIAPLIGATAMFVSIYGLVTGNGMEAAIWGSVAALGAVLVAGFVDIVISLGHSIRAAASPAV